MGELLSKALETGIGKSEGSAHMIPHERLITLREVFITVRLSTRHDRNYLGH